MSVEQGFFFAKIRGDIDKVNQDFQSTSGTSERLALSAKQILSYIDNTDSINSISDFNEVWPIYKEGVVYLDLRTERSDEALKNSQALQFIENNKSLFKFEETELNGALKSLGLNNKETVEIQEAPASNKSKDRFQFNESLRPSL